MKAYGKQVWVIPDTYSPNPTDSEIPAHEAIILTNTGDEEAEVLFDILFEDNDPVVGLHVKIGAMRSKHIRMDWFKDLVSYEIPIEVPYSMVVRSSKKIVVQYSRMDTRLGGMALMTSLGYPCE
jgi:hypothetical protein